MKRLNQNSWPVFLLFFFSENDQYFSQNRISSGMVLSLQVKRMRKVERKGESKRKEMRVHEGTVSSNKHLLCALNPV